MITVIELNTIEELSTLLYEQKEDKKIGRFRSACLYRGLPNESYSLVTSLKRNCKEKQKELEKYYEISLSMQQLRTVSLRIRFGDS